MLQRLQTIWLLLAASSSAATFYFPFYSGLLPVDGPHTVDGTTTLVDAAMIDLTANTNIWLSILTVFAGALAFVTIFLFNNRKLQLKLCYLGIFVTTLLLILYFVEVNNFIEGNFAITCLFHFTILIFYILAVRGIWKDEKLIRSMNRLR